MYKFNYKLTYNESDDDDVYRKELLDVFFLKEYNGEKINSTVNKIIKPLIKPPQVLYFDRSSSKLTLV